MPTDPMPLPMLEEEARRVAGEIGGSLPEGVGFTLLMFNFGETDDAKFTTYISSADRETMRETLRELLAKWDAGEHPEAPVAVHAPKRRRKWKFGGRA